MTACRCRWRLLEPIAVTCDTCYHKGSREQHEVRRFGETEEWVTEETTRTKSLEKQTFQEFYFMFSRSLRLLPHWENWHRREWVLWAFHSHTSRPTGVLHLCPLSPHLHDGSSETHWNQWSLLPPLLHSLWKCWRFPPTKSAPRVTHSLLGWFSPEMLNSAAYPTSPQPAGGLLSLAPCWKPPPRAHPRLCGDYMQWALNQRRLSNSSWWSSLLSLCLRL